MASIFKKQQDYVRKPGRNNFDLSFSNNFTTKIGQITPIMCKEVNPGDKFNINFAAGLRAMPLAFPIQTPLQAQFSFFYVRNRTLWNDWMDFYGRTKDNLIHPYISIPFTRAHEIGTGTLADYLGVPTTYADETGSDYVSVPLRARVPDGTTTVVSTDITGTIVKNEELDVPVYNQDIVAKPVEKLSPSLIYNLLNFRIGRTGEQYSMFLSVSGQKSITTERNNFSFNGHFELPFNSLGSSNVTFHLMFFLDDPTFTSNRISHSTYLYYCTVTCTYDSGSGRYVGDIDPVDLDRLNPLLAQGSWYLAVAPDSGINIEEMDDNYLILGRSYVNTTDVSDLNNPFVVQDGSEVPDIRLNALPFRAYEAIYNAYYRNEINDPFVLNGTPEYNRYITNLDGGADSITPLFLRMRNYELDFLTSAVPSPQQGIAPLVGVSSTGVFKFEDEDGNVFTLTPKIGSDGNTLTGIDSYDEGLPVGNLKRMTELIRYGISINDFRNVNSLQRYLETNIRRGLKYREQILSHHGVHVRYDELDMPEYLGGLTRHINVTQITSTAETSEMVLGEYGGQAGLFTQSTHGINHYFDEPGFLFCMLTIVPIPNYSQLLDKKFLKDNQLDYFFPEFNHIGYQPIDYREVTPIQAKLHEVDYNSVFGYQRPYYDLVSSVDEVHGLMRTTMQGFLLTRNFGTPPRLGHDFLEINPEDMTNPFVDTSVDSDTFVGQVSFDIKAKRAVSKVAIPRLE